VFVIVPVAELPPAIPFTCQVTAVFASFVTVALNCCGPRAATNIDDGEFDIDGGVLTVKLTEFDAPPPGEGLVTTTGYVPAVAWSLALKEMVSCVELTKVAACATPL
jgi:hypothetical protein